MSIDPELLRKHVRETTWDIVNRHIIGSAPKRFVSGCAVSSKDVKGATISLAPDGLTDDGEPIPLVLGHDEKFPLGRIIRTRVKGDRVEFDAELLNSGYFAHADMAWGSIVLRETLAVSIATRNLGAASQFGVFYRWKIDEISIVEVGLDPGALLYRCWSQAPFVSLRGPSIVTTHWNLRKEAEFEALVAKFKTAYLDSDPDTYLDILDNNPSVRRWFREHSGNPSWLSSGGDAMLAN